MNNELNKGFNDEFNGKLINILDEIVVSDFYLNEKEIEQFIENTLHLMYTFIEENPKLITEEDFIDLFKENINELVLLQFENDISYELNDDAEDDIELLLEYCYEMFFETIYPNRQYDVNCNVVNENKHIIFEKITKIKNTYQPEQRTTEWYNFRYNLITASNAYKCFENIKTYNQLIYEKCQPLTIIEKNINIESSLHWGQRYENISVMIYENLYNTKIGDFGCIKHPNYDFLGASPDGINIDENSPYYGFMLEIKNPISRNITGIPKKEYWVQCQLQLECCDLEYCHFLETSFMEYESREQFINDGNFLLSEDGKQKGIIISFFINDKIYYEYKPLLMEEDNFELWLEKTIQKNIDKNFFNIIYWKLNVLSCVLIKRNRLWFQNNINDIEKIWNIIVEERKSLDYEKRAPNKKIKIESTNNEKDKIINECFLKIDDNNKINLLNGNYNLNISNKLNKNEKIIIKIE